MRIEKRKCRVRLVLTWTGSSLKKTEKADETAKNMDKDDKGTKQDNDDKAQK